MKKLFVLVAAAMMVLFAGCNKEDSKNSIEGKWYCYENGEQHTRFYLGLENGKADMILPAWGDRYKGSYTYDASTGALTITNAEQICRGNAGELGEQSTLTSNLFNGWPGPTEADHISWGPTIKMTFTVKGDTAQFEYTDKNGGLSFEMTRKK